MVAYGGTATRTGNTNDDNRDDDNLERETRQATTALPSDRAERVRQRVSFIRAAKFTRTDTCASARPVL